MKKNLIVVFATLVAIALLTSTFKLQSHVEFPPAGGLANDPNQTNCAHCHSALGAPQARNSQFIIRLAPTQADLANDSNIVGPSHNQYTPHCSQWVSLELTGANTNWPGDTPYYGFQFTALRANDSMAGTFTLVDPNTSRQDNSFTELQGSVSPIPAGDTIYYVGHNNPNHLHYIQTWHFLWNTPDSSAGPVTFYYAGNLGNGNLPGDIPLTNPDTIFVGQVTLHPGPTNGYCTTGIANVPGNNINAVSVYPVPFSDRLNADLYLNTPSTVSITLMSIDGHAIKELYDGTTPQGHFSRSFEIGSVAAGMYFVRVQSGTDTKVVKVLKY